MNVTAIVAEYNPMHNGHLYQLQQAREKTDADYIIVVMSGDYVQRGTPAIIDKYSRAEMALICGADLVLELPAYYSSASMENYAASAMSLIDKLGIVTTISFGSECGDINILKTIATELPSDDCILHDAIQKHMRLGMSYPAAREAALLDTGFNSDYAKIMKNPNNSLGIAYIRALINRNSPIKYHTTKRIVSEHNDSSDGAYSASALRSSLITKEAIFDLANSTPELVLNILKAKYNVTFPITENDFSDILLYKIHSCFTKGMAQYSSLDEARIKSLSQYADITEDISAKIINSYNCADTYSDLINLVKSKDITYARISRALLHILLDITTEDYERFINDDYHYFARILGISTAASPLLHSIKAHTSIPLLSKLADYNKILDSENARKLLFSNIQATNLYEKTACKKYRQSFKSEFSKEIIRL